MNVKKVTGSIIATLIRIIIAAAVLYFLYESAIRTYNFGYKVFADVPYSLSPGMDIQVTITETMDKRDIAEYFENVGLVEDWKLFYAQIFFSEYKETIRPGVYDLNNSMKSEEMLEIIGGEIDEDGLSVPNGSSEPGYDEGTEVPDGEEEIMDNGDWYDDALNSDENGYVEGEEVPAE